MHLHLLRHSLRGTRGAGVIHALESPVEGHRRWFLIIVLHVSSPLSFISGHKWRIWILKGLLGLDGHPHLLGGDLGLLDDVVHLLRGVLHLLWVLRVINDLRRGILTRHGIIRVKNNFLMRVSKHLLKILTIDNLWALKWRLDMLERILLKDLILKGVLLSLVLVWWRQSYRLTIRLHSVWCGHLLVLIWVLIRVMNKIHIDRFKLRNSKFKL